MATPPPTADAGIFDHLKDLVTIITPLMAAIIGLVVYAWKQMEKNIGRIESALATHIDADNKAHNDLATIQRQQDEDLSELATKHAMLEGEHKAQHRPGA